MPRPRENTAGLSGIPEANLEAAGIPDSPIMMRDYETQPNPILDFHVGGVLVRDLPLEAQGRIVYMQTDEAMEERNARPEVREASGIRLGADEVTKGCEKRKDDVIDRGMEPWESPNAMEDLIKQHVGPGFSGKFLSPTRVDKNGTRGFEVVKQANGEPVKLRNMVLGQMPEEKVAKRNKFYRDKSDAAAKVIKEQYMAEAGPLAVSGDE